MKRIVSHTILSLLTIGILTISFLSLPTNGDNPPYAPTITSSTPAITSTTTTKTTTTETLSPMTTNKVYDTTDSCFQGKGGNNTIKYVFKPNGFMYWQNKDGSNFTVTGYSIGQITTGTSSPVANSTALDYSISNPGFTSHIFLKNLPSSCGNLPSSVFKITITGTTTNPTIFTFNFGNPNNQKILCDNINHIITYGVTGINFTDSITFNPSCTNTSLSFSIPIGSFKIDPVTITTATDDNTVSSPVGTNRLYDLNGYWIAMWTTGFSANFVYSSCNDTNDCANDATKWTTATTLTSISGRLINVCEDETNNKIFVVRGIATTTSLNVRRWSFSGGVMTADYAEQTITTTNTITGADARGSFTSCIFNTIDLYVSIGTCVSVCGTYHMEIWQCAGGTSGCTKTKVQDLSYTVTNHPLQSLLVYQPTNNKIGAVSGWPTNNGKMNYTSCPSTCAVPGDWSAAVSSGWTFQTITSISCIGISATIYCNSAGADNLKTISDGGTSWSTTTLPDATTSGQITSISSGTGMYIFYTPATTTLAFDESVNTGTNWNKFVVTTSETSIKGSVHTNRVIQSNNKLGALYIQGAASPFNIKFTNVVIPYPALIQEKTTTFTALSSPTSTFASSVTAGNIVYVIPSVSVSANTISSVTDSGGNTYTFLTRQNSLSTVGNVEGWYSVTTTGGTLTVTVNLGISLSGAIIINEIGGARTDTPLYSIGTGTGTSTSVTSYSPDANSLVIGGLNSGCITACTVTAGSGYTLDDNAAVSTLFQASSEHITNTGTSETTPFTLSVSNGYNEISVAFAPSGSTVAESRTLSLTLILAPTISKFDTSLVQQSIALTASVIKSSLEKVSGTITLIPSIIKKSTESLSSSLSLVASIIKSSIAKPLSIITLTPILYPIHLCNGGCPVVSGGGSIQAQDYNTVVIVISMFLVFVFSFMFMSGRKRNENNS